ncbi:MAG TPA: hypothetical protein VKY92_13510 [Verrucomicrobiae bacterium]|nr:hypothetical protein [Verrucomicrobiae bacterium]
MDSPPVIQTRDPAVLTTAAILGMSLFGLFLIVPVLISMMIVSILQFGIPSFLIPLAIIALATFFLPFGFGNAYLKRLVEPLRPSGDPKEAGYVVQLTRNPRQRSGLWAVIEDADDIGWLQFTDSAVVFTGDSLRLRVPYDRVRDLKKRNAGWRSLFAYGPQTMFSLAEMPEAGAFLFAERSSYVIPTSRKVGLEIYTRLQEKTSAQKRVE